MTDGEGKNRRAPEIGGGALGRSASDPFMWEGRILTTLEDFWGAIKEVTKRWHVAEVEAGGHRLDIYYLVYELHRRSNLWRAEAKAKATGVIGVDSRAESRAFFSSVKANCGVDVAKAYIAFEKALKLLDGNYARLRTLGLDAALHIANRVGAENVDRVVDEIEKEVTKASRDGEPTRAWTRKIVERVAKRKGVLKPIPKSISEKDQKIEIALAAFKRIAAQKKEPKSARIATQAMSEMAAI